jgi:DNA (cytosine-5)-methyltransferase 1
MKSRPPACIDCFAGAGGLSIGLHRAGFSVKYAFDFNSDSIETYNTNPNYLLPVAECISIENLPSKKLLSKAGLNADEVILLAGGPPCQGFSIQRIGKDEDDRNSLIRAYMERILEIKPWFFLLENVPGLKGHRGKQILDNLLVGVRKAGYICHFSILDASDYGVPQRRKRVFIVGERLPSGHSRFIFPKKITPNKNTKITVKRAISHLPSPPADGSAHPNWPNHRSDRLSSINKKRLQALKPGQGRTFLPSHLLADCHRVSAEDMGHRNVYGRMSWNEVAPTITARFDSFTRGMFGHPKDLRTISLREGAILQGFPERFTFQGTKVSVTRQIGNAVPPPWAEAIGKSIFKAFTEEKLGPTVFSSIKENTQQFLFAAV